MSISSKMVLACFNTAVAAFALGLSQSARQTDRFVYVVYLPWISPADVRRRIEAGGGSVVADAVTRLASKVAVREPDALARLAASGAVLIFTASPSPNCARAAS